MKARNHDRLVHGLAVLAAVVLFICALAMGSGAKP